MSETTLAFRHRLRPCCSQRASRARLGDPHKTRSNRAIFRPLAPTRRGEPSRRQPTQVAGRSSRGSTSSIGGKDKVARFCASAKIIFVANNCALPDPRKRPRSTRLGGFGPAGELDCGVKNCEIVRRRAFRKSFLATEPPGRKPGHLNRCAGHGVREMVQTLYYSRCSNRNSKAPRSPGRIRWVPACYECHQRWPW